jgi:hypothetical protein
VTAILICAVFFAMLSVNLWFGLAKGRIVGRYGIVARGDYPYEFWGAVAFSGFGAVLFGVLLLAFLDPRNFQPVLRLLSCKGALAACLRQELSQ